MVVFLYIIYAVIIAAPIYLVILWWRIRSQEKEIGWESIQDYETLIIEVPRNNEKAPLAAEQMFASLHGIYSDALPFQHHLSFEIVSVDKFVQFYVQVPKTLIDFVEGQIYAQYPTVEINRTPDYAKKTDLINKFSAGCELTTTKLDVYPLKIFSDFEVDPLSAITSVMSKINPGEEVWLQVLIRPVADDWQEKGIKHIEKIRKGHDKIKLGWETLPKIIWTKMLEFAGNFMKVLVNAGREVELSELAEAKEIKLSGPVEDALKAIEFKIMKLGFETKIRIMAISDDSASAQSKVDGIAATFKQFNSTNANGFKRSEIVVNDPGFLENYQKRDFQSEGYILNIAELAAIYHLPHLTVSTPHIVWAGSKKGEPPADLPLLENNEQKDLTVLGETNFRNVYRKFGIKLDDRRRHCYIIGKSGVGKSTLIENMVYDDVVEGRGVIVVDPHGELADKVLACIPDERVEDVVVFDPADRSFPIAFNLLDKVEDDFKGMVASGFVGIFKKIFGDSWGPRLEHILRNTVLALMDYPESTMLDIPRMLTEKRFREKVVSFVVDPVIRDFWVTEFAQYDAKFRTEAVSPILNKVGQFLSTSTIRNIVGQPHSRINIREIMDSRKILVINLSHGKIGEDNSALLGAMMITKVQLSAMSRADVTSDNRPDCYLYVDEFQNFATESFAVILSEARKYNLNLTVANQYVAQMPEVVRDAVFGNVGTVVSFRVGGTDATFLVKEYEPVFDANDLVNLDKFQAYIKLLIDGVTKPAFSARTLPPVSKISGNLERIIESSRKKYASDRAAVESMIMEKSLELENELKAESDASHFVSRDDKERPVHYGSPATSPSAEVKAPEKTPDAENQNNENVILETIAEKADDKNRILKWQNIIGDKIYKEQTARGGVKWYVGQEALPEKFEEQGIIVDDAGKKMIELMKRVYKTKELPKELEKKDDDGGQIAEKNNSDNATADNSKVLDEGVAVNIN
ncbi:MAG: type IV secretion system DNA-binding domain-containing protein [Candidatus Berkelbacteria bacterium]|nr:type IV secretion system DNA-binding domain-containing protein [Candidatus Berkelbacteria bacterium]